jgi:hypothetical protein
MFVPKWSRARIQVVSNGYVIMRDDPCVRGEDLRDTYVFHSMASVEKFLKETFNHDGPAREINFEEFE